MRADSDVGKWRSVDASGIPIEAFDIEARDPTLMPAACWVGASTTENKLALGKTKPEIRHEQQGKGDARKCMCGGPWRGAC